MLSVLNGTRASHSPLLASFRAKEILWVSRHAGVQACQFAGAQTCLHGGMPAWMEAGTQAFEALEWCGKIRDVRRENLGLRV